MSATGKSSEMCPVRQKRFPSGNPDLCYTNAVPRDTAYDLTDVHTKSYSQCDEFTHKVPKPGNCVRKDGRA